MKMKSKYMRASLAAALFVGMSALTAVAGPSTGAYTPLKTSADAQALPEKANVMLACSGCQTIKPVDKTGVAAWFETKVKHDCPACGGKVTFNAEKAGGGTKFTHTCSMCGNASAYVCASH